MFRMIVNNNADGAKKYFDESLSQEDYYLGKEADKKQEIIGNWHGKAAELLGISGEIDRETFHRLCDNINPKTGERLNPRDNADRRVAYDMNFHPPKSLSILYLLNKDERLLEVFHNAKRETMQDIEMEMKTRVRIDGKDEDRTTGNLIYADFIHTTARPVNGIPDPHLHSHCFVFNTTFDPVEQRFKAGQFGDLKRDASFFEASFHSRLAKGATEIGYEVEKRITKTGKEKWEIKDVPESTVEKFSKRTDQVDRTAEEIEKEFGIKLSAEAKDKLGAQTREKKRNDLDQKTLDQIWQEQLTGKEKRALRQATERSRARQEELAKLTETEKQLQRQQEIQAAIDSVDKASGHEFERQSVVTTKCLATTALKSGVGRVRVEDIKKEINQKKFIIRNIDGEEKCTTPEVLQEEKFILSFAHSGRGAVKPIADEKFEIYSDELKDNQLEAIRHILKTQDRITGILGAAGTGKTTLMKEAVTAIEKHKKNVFTFAPTAQAARDVLRKDGFKNAETIAALIKNPELQKQLKNQVMWIDEAGMISSKDMQTLFAIAQRQEARIILSGDIRQHNSVMRGDALRILQQTGSVNFAHVGEIIRQKGEYKKAIECLSKGHIKEGYEIFEKHDWIKEIAKTEDRNKQIAADYVTLTAKNKKDVLVISPTHKEADEVTKAIREQLREANLLKGKEKTFLSQRGLNLTETQRAAADQYHIGMIIQFHQHAKGFKSGEKARVVASKDGKIFVQNQQGKKTALPLDEPNKFNVYSPQDINLSKGDKIRITQNGKTKDRRHELNNGQIYQVDGFIMSEDIKLQNGWIIDKQYGNIDHGYVVTSHASQGKTVDQVLIAQSVESFKATSQQQFYVSASRGREKATIYTDNKQYLKETVIKKSAERMSALELANDGRMKRERIEEIARMDERARESESRVMLGESRSVTAEQNREASRPTQSVDRSQPSVIEKFGAPISKERSQRQRERSDGLQRNIEKH